MPLHFPSIKCGFFLSFYLIPIFSFFYKHFLSVKIPIELLVLHFIQNLVRYCFVISLDVSYDDTEVFICLDFPKPSVSFFDSGFSKCLANAYYVTDMMKTRCLSILITNTNSKTNYKQVSKYPNKTLSNLGSKGNKLQDMVKDSGRG